MNPPCDELDLIMSCCCSERPILAAAPDPCAEGGLSLSRVPWAPLLTLSRVESDSCPPPPPTPGGAVAVLSEEEEGGSGVMPLTRRDSRYAPILAPLGRVP